MTLSRDNLATQEMKMEEDELYATLLEMLSDNNSGPFYIFHHLSACIYTDQGIKDGKLKEVGFF